MQKGTHPSGATRQKMRDRWTPARRAALAKRSSELMRTKWQDQKFRARMLEMMAELRRDPEYRARVSEGLKRAAARIKAGKVSASNQEEATKCVTN